MKNHILAIVFILFQTNQLFAQMTLGHAFPMGAQVQSEIVNLSNSGKKIIAVNEPSSSDTIYFYNMDYSFWKKIILPVIPGHSLNFANLYDNGGGLGLINIFYPSETLFNSDTLLEVAVIYQNYPSTTGISTLYVINETGTLTDSITNVSGNTARFAVFETSPGVFKATIPTTSGFSVYDLPGTIPCNSCSSPLGIAKTEKPGSSTDIATQPFPNPSVNEVKITFTLPEGVKLGDLILYSSTGQKIKSYQVDNRFGFIILDNSQLPAGMYYYNIVANGEISSTQKLVLLK